MLIQGDHSARSKPPVDIDVKVVFESSLALSDEFMPVLANLENLSGQSRQVANRDT